MELTPASLKTFLDANPGKYNVHNIEADGYSPSGQIGNLLVTPGAAVPNPTPQPQVAKPFTAISIMAVVSQANQVKCLTAGVVAMLSPLIDKQDAAGIAALGTVCVEAGLITTDEAAAIGGVLTTTQGDPKWPATVPGPSDLFAQFAVLTVDNATIDAALGRVTQ